MSLFKRGDLVVLNGKIAAVVGVAGDPNVPEEHIALWYGASVGDTSLGTVVWTVPEEYCELAPAPEFRH